MANLKISGLTAATLIDATDEFVINDTATPSYFDTGSIPDGTTIRLKWA